MDDFWREGTPYNDVRRFSVVVVITRRFRGVFYFERRHQRKLRTSFQCGKKPGRPGESCSVAYFAVSTTFAVYLEFCLTTATRVEIRGLRSSGGASGASRGSTGG